jgi:hypothetical protein
MGDLSLSLSILTEARDSGLSEAGFLMVTASPG